MYGFTNICKYTSTKFLSIETSTDNNEPLRGTEESPKNKILLILDKLVRPQTPISQQQHGSGFTPEDSGRTGRHQRNNPWQICPCFFFFAQENELSKYFLLKDLMHVCLWPGILAYLRKGRAEGPVPYRPFIFLSWRKLYQWLVWGCFLMNKPLAAEIFNHNWLKESSIRPLFKQNDGTRSHRTILCK